MHERKFVTVFQSLDQALWQHSEKKKESEEALTGAVVGHRIRYPDPLIKVNDTVKIDLATGKITDYIKFDTGVIAMVTGGRNMGRVGVVTHRERHDGGFNIVHIKDAIENSFATRESNVFIIGNEKPWVSLPKGKGVKVFLLPPCGLAYILLTVNSSLLRKSVIVVVRTLSLVTEQTRDASRCRLKLLQLVDKVNRKARQEGRLSRIWHRR